MLDSEITKNKDPKPLDDIQEEESSVVPSTPSKHIRI